MESGESIIHSRMLPDLYILQREQREELASLVKKYGEVWEPWRKELKRFRDEGKKLVD